MNTNVTVELEIILSVFESVFGLSTRVTRVTRVTSRTARVVRMRRRLDLLDYSNPHLT